MTNNRYSGYVLSIPMYLILTIITCGIFNLYWNYLQMQACNDMLEREEFNFMTWFFLGLVTCGIYHFFYQYNMGMAINEIQRREGLAVFDQLPLISVLVSVFGLSIVVDCIHQAEINKIAETC